MERQRSEEVRRARIGGLGISIIIITTTTTTIIIIIMCIMIVIVIVIIIIRGIGERKESVRTRGQPPY